ncbi:hypothetical protein NST56_11565 [Bacillus sp. FSL R5-0560]
MIKEVFYLKLGGVNLNIFIWIAMFIAIFGGSYAGYKRNKKKELKQEK